MPIGFCYTTIDGCAEILASPGGESRYAGLPEEAVKCKFLGTLWLPETALTHPTAGKAKLRTALSRWRKQTSYPRPLCTLARAPAEPVTDRRGLELAFGRSDYFTVRSVTEIARASSFEEGIGVVFPASNWWASAHQPFPVDAPPYHVSAQALILNRNPATGEYGIVLTAYNPASTPIAGGVSASMAEQMTADPIPEGERCWWEEGDETRPREEDGDGHIFETLRRGLLEEFGLSTRDYVPPLLLSACLEAEMFFVTFIFMVHTKLEPAQLFDRWRSAPDRQESQILGLYLIGAGGEESVPRSGLDAVVRLLAADAIDLGPCLLPQPRPPRAWPIQIWHPATRMRLYVAAKHWWGTAIDRHMKLDIVMPTN